MRPKSPGHPRPLASHRRAVSSLLGVAAAVATVACVVGVLPVQEAAAAPLRRSDSVAELKARAAEIAERLETLGIQSSELDEDYNAASLQYEELAGKVAQSQAAVDAARAALGEHRKVAQDYAIDAFTGASSGDESLTSLASGSTADASQRRTYLAILHGDRTQIIDDVSAAAADLDRQEAALQASAAKVDATRVALARTKAELQRNLSDTQALLAQTQGDLKVAVEAEAARLEAAREAAAKADADAQAQRDAATRRVAAARQAAAVVRATPNGVSPGPVTTVGGSTTTVAPEGPSDGGAGPPNPAAATAIAAARTQLGVPYRWGASSPGSGFDCSGLVMYAYAKAGVSLPHSSRSLRSMSRRISADELQPGDLVFGGSPVHHVGLYIGGGQMIHAPQSGDVVKISSIYSTSRPVSFGRL